MRAAFAEALGTAFLLIAVVGSGIMAADLADGSQAVALLANAIATGGALYALITVFAPLSGAHFNPAVTLFQCLTRAMPWRSALLYVPAQIAGGIAGVAVAHAMFALPLLQASQHARASFGEIVGEVVATTGLLLTIWGTVRAQPDAVPATVAAYIVGAYWFTSSTSFANPAVTLARSLTDTFAGIAPSSVLGFIAAQLLAVPLVVVLVRALVPRSR